jgi:hypothetical protein
LLEADPPRLGDAMKLMRVAIFAMSMLVFPGAIAASPAQTKWTPFQSAGDGFRIEFPGTPTVKRDTLPSRVGPAPHVTAQLNSKGFTYTVELTTYASASPPDAVLDLFAGAVAKSGKLREETPLKVGADAARRLVSEVGDGKFIATSLLVTDGTRFYHVLCVSSPGQETSANVKRFINSFELTPP